uniref:RWP-RK domain-containing protein n=1 Tax=Guillardia theta TaxID=55529 RepID=A0A7S4PKY2_GUITH|mmetsp:Transcript_5707/g.20075  ORF Transcript_5707/g.20075 Transcript_5707/m.20075 type:complete len:326 (+) Transcript_5707:334-1311(+)
MKRSFSLSELHESLEESGTMRRVKSQENMLKTMSPLSPAVGPHVARAPVLTEKELREHFNMPLNEVAKKYGMCTTALKKLCRKYGVMQWPHRKLRSLEKKIASLKAEQRYTTDGHGQLDDEIRKLESQRESLISGNGTVGLDDDAGGWSPTASSPAEAIDIADLYDSIGVDEMHHSHGDLSHQPRRPSVGAANARSFNSSDRAGERNDGSNEERLQHQIQTLEEENSSLKALSRSLMKERQELLNKTSATNVEMASLRQLCENLQLQLRSLTEGKGDAGRNPGLIQEDLLTDSKRKPLQVLIPLLLQNISLPLLLPFAHFLSRLH